MASLLGDPTLTPLIRLSSLIIPAFASSSFIVHYFNGQRLFKIQARLKFLRAAARLTVIPLLAIYLGLKGAVTGYVLVPLVVLSYSLPLYFKKRTVQKITEPFSSRKLLDFAVPIMFFMLSYEVLINIDLFMVKRILASDQLTGIYNASLLVGKVSFYLLSVLALVFLPTISHIIENKGKKAALEMMKRTFKYLWFILVLFVFLWPIWSPTIVNIFFSSRFAEDPLFTRILAGGLPFLTIFYILAFTLNGAGHVKKVVGITAGGVLINIVLNLILIPKYQLVGAAIATSSISVLLGIAMIIAGFKIIGKFLSNKTIFLPCIIMTVSLIPTLFMYFLNIHTYAILAYTLIPLLSYLLILWKTKEIDIHQLKDVFQKKKA